MCIFLCPMRYLKITRQEGVRSKKKRKYPAKNEEGAGKTIMYLNCFITFSLVRNSPLCYNVSSALHLLGISFVECFQWLRRGKNENMLTAFI